MELYELRGKGKGEATRVLDAPDEDGKKKQTQTQTQTQATQGDGKGKGRARLQNIEEEDEDDDEEGEEEATQPGKKQKGGSALPLPIASRDGLYPICQRSSLLRRSVLRPYSCWFSRRKQDLHPALDPPRRSPRGDVRAQPAAAIPARRG
jgi:hypothetical protein